MPEHELIEVQPREISEAAQRACYAAGADPEEAAVAGRAVLIAERAEQGGLELLRHWTSTSWQSADRPPAPRTALLQHDLLACGGTPLDDDLPEALVTAVAERTGRLDPTVASGPLHMSPDRWKAFHDLADTYLVALRDEA